MVMAVRNVGWPNTDKMRRRFSIFLPDKHACYRSRYHIFWVARMIMASLELVGDEKKTLTDAEISERITVQNVYFTGIIRDEIGRKCRRA